MRMRNAFLALVFTITIFWTTNVQAQPNTISIQGQLIRSDLSPVTGNRVYRLRFFQASNGDNQLGATVNGTVDVSPGGRFTIELVPPAELTGALTPHYELAIDSAASPDSTIDPGDVFPERVKMHSVQYALDSKSIGGKTISHFVLADDIATTSGAFSQGTFWRLGGNLGTIGGTHFIGTLDNSPFDIRANNTPAMRYVSPTTPTSTVNIVGNPRVNIIDPDAIGIVLAGGGDDATTDSFNRVYGSYSTISGGAGNIAAGENGAPFATSQYITIGGGRYNLGKASYSTIGGGIYNNTAGFVSTIGGGNLNNATGAYSTVSGGEQNMATSDYASIGGGVSNTATSFTATIAGGQENSASGPYASIGGGSNNRALSQESVVAGGFSNEASGVAASVLGGQRVAALGENATAGGGRDNNAAGLGSFVGGGANNNAFNNYSFVGGGTENSANEIYSVVVGGSQNNASMGGSFVGGGLSNNVNGSTSVIVGGDRNTAEGGGSFIGGGNNNEIDTNQSVIVGGFNNTITGRLSVVGGGSSNSAKEAFSAIIGGEDNITSGTHATVLGGEENEAIGNHSIAAGYKAKALHDGSVVFNDSLGFAFESGERDQFLINADNGVRINTNIISSDPLYVVQQSGARVTAASQDNSYAGYRTLNDLGEWFIGLNSGSANFHVFNNTLGVAGMVILQNGALGLGGVVGPTDPIVVGSDSTNGNGAHLTAGGVWTNGSDVNSKTAFEPVDNQAILNKILEMPVTRWRYKGESEDVHHIGPMAQDFKAAFGLGESERHIGTVDADGVSMAAIKALNERIEKKNARIAELETRLARLESLLIEGDRNE